MTDEEAMVEAITQESKPRAWITYRKKNGKGKHSGTIATNPEYIKVHNEWHWIEIKLPLDAAKQSPEGKDG
jgi:hypothetical protein